MVQILFDFTKFSSSQFQTFVFEVAKRVISPGVERDFQLASGSRIADLAYFGPFKHWDTGIEHENSAIVLEVKAIKKPDRVFDAAILDQLFSFSKYQKFTHCGIALPFSVTGPYKTSAPYSPERRVDTTLSSRINSRAMAASVEGFVWDYNFFVDAIEKYPDLRTVYESLLSETSPSSDPVNPSKEPSIGGQVYLLPAIGPDIHYIDLLRRLEFELSEKHGITVRKATAVNLLSDFRSDHDWLIIASDNSSRAAEPGFNELVNRPGVRQFNLILDPSV